MRTMGTIRKFNPHNGNPLEERCPACDMLQDYGNHYCEYCGEKLTRPKPKKKESGEWQA